MAASEAYSSTAAGDNPGWLGRMLRHARSRSNSRGLDVANTPSQGNAFNTYFVQGEALSQVSAVENGVSNLTLGIERDSSQPQPIPITASVARNADTDFRQPEGEGSYKNSARIQHSFGPTGLAPLAKLDEPKNDVKMIPIMVSWPYEGKTVFVTGTFNNWKRKIRLNKSSLEFSTVIDMPLGTHRLKFIVDDEWKCSEHLPMESDPEGNLVNYVEVNDEEGDKQGDGLDGLSYIENSSIMSVSPEESYNCIIPPYLTRSSLISSDAFDPPPILPPQLDKVILNSKEITHDDLNVLPVPTHVTLNHLYACSIKDGVMAIGCTSRYMKKYVTTVLYKPVF